MYSKGVLDKNSQIKIFSRHPDPDKETAASIQQAVEKEGYLTCMGFGADIYRSFDGMKFAFSGTCSYILYAHGGRSIAVDMEHCKNCKDCVKVGSKEVLVIANSETC